MFHFTPVPGERIHFRCAISVNLETMEESLLELVQEKNAEITIRNLQEDAPIWEHKRYLTRPLVCDGDGSYGQLRHWTKQFYIPESEAVGAKVDEKKPSPPAHGQDEPEREDRYSEIAAPSSACEKSDPRPIQPSSVTHAATAEAPGAVEGDLTRAVSRIFFEKMPADFKPAAVNSDFVVQYDIGGEEGGPYFVEVRDKKYRVALGKHATPNVRVTIHASDWLHLHSGELGSARAYLTGKLKVAGDLKLARRLATIFPITPSRALP
jgi:putative sterol carrier protein